MSRRLEPLRELPGQLLFGRWPRIGLALRTALSAALAWQVALWLPVPIAEQYPYYAPLGAVVSSYGTVRASARNSAQAVAAAAVGAGVALLAQVALPSSTAVVFVVVAVATLAAGWSVFGEQRGWVATVAVFVLVVGTGDPLEYALAYCSLITLGGLVAVLVNMVIPEMPLARSEQALRELAQVLADQMDDLARTLREEQPPTQEQWRERLWALEPVRRIAGASEQQVEESLRDNLRGRRHRESVRRQRVLGVMLGNLAARVQELTELLVEVHAADVREITLAPGPRGAAAEVLTALAEFVRCLPQDVSQGRPMTPVDEQRELLRDQLRRLASVVTATWYPGERDRQTAGTVVTLLRRCLGTLQLPTDDPNPEAVLPTPWALPDPHPALAGRRPRRHRIRR